MPMNDAFDLFCELVNNLRSDNSRLRREAIGAIAKVADNSCSNILVDAIRNEKDPHVMASLLRVLGSIGAPNLLEFLTNYLKHSEPRVRSNAVETLGLMTHVKEKVVEVLLPLLDDKDNRVVGTVIKTLYDLGDEGGIETLSRLLRGDDNDRRCSAIWAVGAMLYAPELPTIIGYLGSPVYRIHSIASRSVACFGRAAVEPLLADLARHRSARSVFVIIALGRAGDAGAVPALLEQLVRDPASQAWTLEALSYCGGPAIVPQLVERLDHSDPDVRIEVLKAFRRLDCRDQLPAIMAAVDRETDRRVLSTALSTLGELGDLTIADRLQRFLASSEERIRANAVEALGRLGDRRIMSDLKQLVKTGTGRETANAAIALFQFGDIDVIEVLQERLIKGDENVRLSVAYALGKIDLEGVVRPLVDAIRDHSYQVRRMALASLIQRKDRSRQKVLTQVAARPDLLTDRDVVRMLGELGTKEAMAPLMNILKDPSPPPKTGVTPESAAQLWDSLMRELEGLPIDVNEILSRLDGDLVSRLRELLGDEDPHVRCFALHSIGHLNRKEMLGSVVCLLGDEDARVRKYALAALRQLGDRRSLVFLKDRLHEADPAVQGELLATLSELGDKEVLSGLERHKDRFAPHDPERYEKAVARLSQRIQIPQE